VYRVLEINETLKGAYYETVAKFNEANSIFSNRHENQTHQLADCPNESSHKKIEKKKE